MSLSPFVELLTGDRVTRWKLLPGLTQGRMLWVLLPFALAGLILAFQKEKKKKTLSLLVTCRRPRSPYKLAEPSAAARLRFNLEATVLDF